MMNPNIRCVLSESIFDETYISPWRTEKVTCPPPLRHLKPLWIFADLRFIDALWAGNLLALMVENCNKKVNNRMNPINMIFKHQMLDLYLCGMTFPYNSTTSTHHHKVISIIYLGK